MPERRTILKTDCADLFLLNRGKVRDIYEIPGHDDKLLMVATDRISAYDVVMDDPIHGKGKLLTEMSLFWFGLLKDIISNHLITANVDEYPSICQRYRDQLEGRSMIVKKVEVLPIECIVRGYLSGSYWKAYQKDTNVCGFQLPEGMTESQIFPDPLFTPSTKADQGDHDENISMKETEKIIGKELVREAGIVSIELYKRAANFARNKGIIIADTKFELGLDGRNLILIDEVLTPDSSRFWPLDQYKPGQGQPSFDKQFLRDYLSSLDWNKTPPPPKLPDEIIRKTGECYREALQKLTL